MASDICVTLGERIRDLRVARGWRQIDLAEQAHIHENYVSLVEAGKKQIGIRTLQRVAKSLDLTVSEITKGL